MKYAIVLEYSTIKWELLAINKVAAAWIIYRDNKSFFDDLKDGRLVVYEGNNRDNVSSFCLDAMETRVKSEMANILNRIIGEVKEEYGEEDKG